ncbi:hypothetical protein Ahu01nite_000530 [Winogradskya humida]|uniref:Methyltransferase family protein n=1 Tax=Winogradskya humida TaxID=113566 RepID=A0ABQ3ZEF1_9ACTN|nr:hypothetical protein Ahu01nite_000530 [Actinoplanes humidus]
MAALAPLPARTTATEGWRPKVPVAEERLTPLGVTVVFTPDRTLPVASGSVDVVLNRHGRVDPAEAARALQPGGTLLTQQVGSDDCAAINTALGAPPAYSTPWNADVAIAQLSAAGFTIVDVRQEWPAFDFYDIGALVYQLRAVPWQVPDFTLDRYGASLRQIDEQIRAEGRFRAHAHRFRISAQHG